jgi:methionyl-tRNA formyltransferase
MKILLFAADRFGLQIVRRVLPDLHVAGVVIAPSDPGRCNAALIAACALASKPCITFESGFLSPCMEALIALQPDLVLMAWWPSRLGEEMLKLPRLGVLNMHPSLLPYCRGKHTTFWSILDAQPFGVTIHWAIERMDSGDIAWQRPIPIQIDDTSETLYRRAQAEMLSLFDQVWPRIRFGEIPRQTNPIARGSYHNSMEIEDASRIDLDSVYSARRLLALLRARTFEGHPAAWFEENGQRYEIRVHISSRD